MTDDGGGGWRTKGRDGEERRSGGGSRWIKVESGASGEHRNRIDEGKHGSIRGRTELSLGRGEGRGGEGEEKEEEGSQLHGQTWEDPGRYDFE